MTSEEIQKLKEDVKTLMDWKAQKTAQQISYPLDTQSQTILGKYFMHIVGTSKYEVVGAASHMITTYTGSQDNLQFNVSPNNIFPYTVNVTSNIFTVTSGSFPNDTEVLAYTDGTYPAPLAVNTIYYVVNSTGTSFKLSLTVGGAAINITTSGTGRQYLSYNL